jgi:hypothetical protein
VKYSAVSYYCLDSGHSLCKHWKTKVFIFEITDGNNKIMPIAMGLFPEESSANLTSFMKAIMGINGGALGELINRTTSVICTDRAKCMRPVMQAMLPLAQHRHDAWHILKNIHDNGFKSEIGYLLNCQRATIEDLFKKAMNEWRKVYPEAAAYALAIPHEDWTYYTAVDYPNSFYLFGRTGSQAVEQEMGRLKTAGVAVRHQLPFTAVFNFIDYFARLVDERKKSCTAMLARTTILTTHADMYCSEQIGLACGYRVRVENLLRGEFEVKSKANKLSRRMVIFLSATGTFGCSCSEDRLRGLPCRHQVSVMAYMSDHKLLSGAHFTNVFKGLIAPFFKKSVYLLWYDKPVLRPILECIHADNTLPPQVDTRPGPPSLKRIPGRAEGGFSSKSGRKLAKTQKNIAAFNTEKAIGCLPKCRTERRAALLQA